MGQCRSETKRVFSLGIDCAGKIGYAGHSTEYRSAVEVATVPQLEYGWMENWSLFRAAN